MKVVLNAEEMDVLSLQEEDTQNKGGYQNLMLDLQRRFNPITGELDLTEENLERIPRYAFDYNNGGWQDRLTGIFSRVLGPQLGR